MLTMIAFAIAAIKGHSCFSALRMVVSVKREHLPAWPGIEISSSTTEKQKDHSHNEKPNHWVLWQK